MSSNEAIPQDRESLFVTTRWTMVLQAGRDGSPQSGQALEELCRTYWFPLYAYVRRRGYGKEDAEDLVQGFFLRLLDKNYLQSVSSDKGKFRAFLLACLKHFLANEWDRAGRQKRGGGAAPLTLNWADAHSRYETAPVDDSTPDRLFDRAWAILLLERVLAQLRAENSGNLALFDCLKPFLTVGKSAIPYAEAAATLEMTEAAARVAVHRLRRRYRELLRLEVAQTLSHPDQVDEEMRALMGAFAA
jgi:DNA-directed RNA polymerase specialized sigma24 family protein